MSDKCNAPVGVFDSGVGGLTVAREIMRNLPEENIVYFGDTARVPYGTKSKDTVLCYSRQIIRFLKTQDVKAIVIACNTASAYALEDVEKELDIPIIGVVKPGAKVACEATHNKKIGVIATEATINSGIYSSYITRQDPQIQSMLNISDQKLHTFRYCLDTSRKIDDQRSFSYHRNTSSEHCSFCKLHAAGTQSFCDPRCITLCHIHRSFRRNIVR